MLLRNKFHQSCFISLGATALLWAFYFSVNNGSAIHAIDEKAHKPVYLQNQDEMNKEMAEIILPKILKQQHQEQQRSQIIKPKTVYAPEQLQSSRGY